MQHKIEEQGNEFYQWLNRGAHVYICGSVAMGKEVRRAIGRIFQSYGKMTAEESLKYWDELTDKNRIHQDLY